MRKSAILMSLLLAVLGWAAGAAWAQEVRIKLKSGRVITIPVEEIDSISFGALAPGTRPPAAGLMNVAAAAVGGEVVRWGSQFDTGIWAARNLIDGLKERGWATVHSPVYPVDLVIRLAGGRAWAISAVQINPFTTESSDRWAKDVAVMVGDSAQGPWQPVGQMRLERRDEYQTLPLRFSPVRASYVLLRVLSNWGGPYAELGEVRVMGQ